MLDLMAKLVKLTQLIHQRIETHCLGNASFNSSSSHAWLRQAKLSKWNDLMGTWEGRNKGYQGNLYTENESVRIIITEANGKAFKGYLKTSTAGKSSKRDIVNGFIAATGDIFATDDHGYYNMKLYENGSLGIVYRKSTPKELPSTLFGLYTKK